MHFPKKRKVHQIRSPSVHIATSGEGGHNQGMRTLIPKKRDAVFIIASILLCIGATLWVWGYCTLQIGREQGDLFGTESPARNLIWSKQPERLSSFSKLGVATPTEDLLYESRQFCTVGTLFLVIGCAGVYYAHRAWGSDSKNPNA